jgi:hypothetical protein
MGLFVFPSGVQSVAKVCRLSSACSSAARTSASATWNSRDGACFSSEFLSAPRLSSRRKPSFGFDGENSCLKSSLEAISIFAASALTSKQS